MKFVKSMCLVGPVAGMILVAFSATRFGGVALMLAAGGSLLITLGSYFFEHIRQNERIEELVAKHRSEMDVLQARLEATGQDFLIKQYADDTVEAVLVRETLRDISELVSTQPGNAAAIKQALAGIERIQFKGFFSRAGELLNKKDGKLLLEKFILHLEEVTRTHSKIPPELEEKIREFKRLIRVHAAPERKPDAQQAIH